jgi:hypothetical protein
VNSTDWKWIAAVALVVSACGAANNTGDDDGLGPYADAGTAPLDTTSDVAGGWIWSARRVNETEPFVTCSVNVSGGVFDIACPQGTVPRDVQDGCKQLRDDLHINGTVVGVDAGHLDGMLDNLVEYEGDTCVGYGFTTGAPYPLPAFAHMSATQTERTELGAFLRHLGGRWDFTLDNTRSAGAACEVNLGLDLGDSPGVKVAISCPADDGTTVAPGCTAQKFLVIGAHLVPGQLDGTLAEETRRTGTCGSLPAVSSEPTATMSARAQ